MNPAYFVKNANLFRLIGTKSIWPVKNNFVRTKCYYIVVLLLLVMFSGCSNEITITEEQLPDEIFYLEGQSSPFTGKCFINYSNSSQLHYMFSYKKGVLNGPYQSYYKDGKLKDQGNYVDGELYGKFIRYAEDGVIISTYVVKTEELAKRS
jgi:antitoxin component YwqK of YwqJK toxin-antitoxin module